MDTSKRVILNTAVNYASLLIKMAVGLFTVRFILQALGETDYGIYVSVAGVVGLLDILNANMTNTSMRFLAHSLGSGDIVKVRKTFNSTLYIHYIIGIITVIIMEVGGFLLLRYVLNIPEEKIIDAHIIFQFMVVTMFVAVVAVPYDAVINAHEQIWMLSLFNIVGTLLSLSIAIFLLYSKGNRLVEYGFLLMLMNFFLRIVKAAYSKRHFEECRNVLLKDRDKEYMKSILSYTGWNLLGSLASSFSLHLRGIIINIFFGVRLNASEGISRRINNYVNMVSVSMTKAINPQIMKSEGSGDRERMIRITELASKYSSFLFALIGIPFAIEAPYIVKLWLKEVPEYAVIFSQISMISMLISKFTFQIVHSIHAVGKIRDFQLVETIIILMPLPIAYCMFKIGYPPVTIYYIGLFVSIPIIIFRFYFGRKIAGLNVLHFIKNAILPILVPIAIASLVIVLYVSIVPPGIVRAASTFVMFDMLLTILFCSIGMGKDERKKWKVMLSPVLSKITGRSR